MPITIAFTYEKITEESAQHGDTSEHGSYQPGGWFYADGTPAESDTREPWKPCDLRHAIESARDLGIRDPSEWPEVTTRHTWFTSVDPDLDYSTGESTFYALHVAGATVATLNRIARVLSGAPIFGAR